MPTEAHLPNLPAATLTRVRRRVVGLTVALSLGGGLLTTLPAAAVIDPAPPPEAAAGTVAFFGDSIGHSAEARTRDRLGAGGYRVVEYNSVDGFTLGDQAAAIRRRVTGTARPHTMLVELGTNDAEKIGDPARFEAAVRSVLDVVSPRVACVRWLDIKPTPTNFYLGVNRNAARFNRILARAAGDYPNVEVMHYSAWAAAAPPGAFLGDGLHLSPLGVREFARLVRQAADGCNPAVASGPFWDVADAAPEAPAVAWMAADAITAGYANATFRARVASQRPAVTRGEFADWLWAAAGRTAAPPAGWVDALGSTPAADWLTAAGAVTVPPDGRFRPGRPLTRRAAARFLWAAAGSPTPASTRVWVDAPPTPAFDWATDTGVLPGGAGGAYRPATATTRLAAAKALHRFHLLAPPPAAETATTPPDPAPAVEAPADPTPADPAVEAPAAAPEGRARRVALADQPGGATGGEATAAGAADEAGAARPNVVLVYTDDQTVAQMQAMPQARAYFARKGVRFSNSITSFPLCCPSRATLLTAQYTHNLTSRDGYSPAGSGL